MKLKRSRNAIIEYLRLGPQNTHDIYQHLQTRFRYHPSMNQLVNLLSKDSRIEIIGQDDITRFFQHSTQYSHRESTYKVNIWSLKEVTL